MKVKKTDLPPIIQTDDVLPSLDDSDIDESQDEDDDDTDDEDDMMADEAAEADDDDYDSDEDTDLDRDADTDDDSWDMLSTPDSIKLDSTTTTTTQQPITTQKATDAPTSASSTSMPTVDPYFTHFDPRNEHQSYKVCLLLIKNLKK